MSTKFEFIDAEKATVTDTGEKKYTITALCEWLDVSTSGYYEWLDRPDSATTQRRAWLSLLVKKHSTIPTRPTVIVASMPSCCAGDSTAHRNSSAASWVNWA